MHVRMANPIGMSPRARHTFTRPLQGYSPRVHLMLRPNRLVQEVMPRLEALEGRLVLSGTPLDLTARGSEGVINDAIFRQCDARPTGTGVISSFVRIQTNA